MAGRAQREVIQGHPPFDRHGDIKAKGKRAELRRGGRSGVPTRPQNSIILEAGAHSDDTGEFQAHYTVRRMSRVQLQRTQKTH